MRLSSKQPGKVVSFLLAISLLTGSFASTTAFALAKAPTGKLASQFAVSEPNSAPSDVESYSGDGDDEFENGSMGYVQPFIDPSYLQQAYIPKTLARAAQSFPSSYDVRDQGKVTSVIRNQTAWGTCWAFGAVGAAESSLFPDDDVVFSPRHLAYFTYNGEANPDLPEDGTAGDTFHAWSYDPSETVDWFHPWYEYGGNTFMSNATLSRIGIQLDSEVPYPETYDYFDYSERDSFGTPILKDPAYGDVEEEYHYTAPYRLVESNYLPTKDQSGRLDGSAIKQELMNGYSIAIAYCSGSYNAAKLEDGTSATMQQYNGPERVVINHEVQIVGWNDTIPAAYFANRATGKQPEHDGGWLIRNSWGEDWGSMGGCFYLSYEDSSISETCQFIASADQPYDHNYQYDGTGWSTTVGVKDKPTEPVKMSNIFTAAGDETIRAAAFYTTTYDSAYSIQVYTDLQDDADPTSGVKAYETEQTGSEPYAGYHTIELNTPVPVNEGEKFAIVVTVKIPETTDQMWYYETIYPIACELNGYCDGITSDADCEAGQSFISYDGENWLDIMDYNEPLYGTDGESEITLANVCLKAFTTDGIDPEEAPSVKVKYNVGADIKATGDIDETYDFPGYYEGKVYAGDTATLSFVPYAEGREFAGVTVNGTADNSFEKNLYTYEVTGGEEDTTLDFSFTIVNKMVLNTAIQFAREAQKGGEYAAAMPTVQKLIDKALTAAEAVAASKTADQAAIDKAWKDLIDVIQLLQFRNGDMTALEFQLTMASQMNAADFTVDSWNAMIAVRDKAQAMFDAKDSLQEDIDAMTKELKEAITALVHATSKDSLQRLVDEASTYDLEKYLETGKAEFQKVLAAAVELLKSDNVPQADYNVMESRLAIAMAALRKIPDRGELDELLARFANTNASDYTEETYAAYSASVEALDALVKRGASKEEIGAAYYVALDNEEKLAAKPSKPDSNKGGSSGSTGGGSSYGGAGTAVVGASVAQAASVVSDTTVNFSLKRGAAYCFKMTVVNGNGQAPSFTVGNGDVLKTQFVAQIGSAYYYRVWATGAPGQSTGVYTQIFNAAPQKHCAVTIV